MQSHISKQDALIEAREAAREALGWVHDARLVDGADADAAAAQAMLLDALVRLERATKKDR